MLAPEDRENGLSRHDLEETTLAAILDDARSLSLFAPNRVIWVSGAESALPRGRARELTKNARLPAQLADYLQPCLLPEPCWSSKPAATISRATTAPRSSACRNFIRRFRRSSNFVRTRSESARRLAQDLAAAAGVQIGLSEIGLLVESLAADAGRIASEIEKLRLYTGGTRKVTADDILRLVPNAQASTHLRFSRRAGPRRPQTLARQPGHAAARRRISCHWPSPSWPRSSAWRWPRAKPTCNTSQQIQAHFSKAGHPHLARPRRAGPANRRGASPEKSCALAIEKIYWADKALRDTRPDDRVVMEELVLSLTN